MGSDLSRGNLRPVTRRAPRTARFSKFAAADRAMVARGSGSPGGRNVRFSEPAAHAIHRAHRQRLVIVRQRALLGPGARAGDDALWPVRRLLGRYGRRPPAGRTAIRVVVRGPLRMG